jgi:hypothetical protein
MTISYIKLTDALTDLSLFPYLSKQYALLTNYGLVKSTPITGHAGPEGSRRVKAPRFLDIGTIWW